MERKMIDENELDQVTGGSIVFNGAHTTCGRNCNNQYKVVDYSKVIAYIAANRYKMSEKTMISNMLASGLLQNL